MGSMIVHNQPMPLVSFPDWRSRSIHVPGNDKEESYEVVGRTGDPADSEPISEVSTALEIQFKQLAETWRRQKGGTSSVMRKAMIPAYQRIIAFGPRVIPLILKELERRPDHWFWALEFLTEANPVTEADRGDIDRMAAAWIRWGRALGYLR